MIGFSSSFAKTISIILQEIPDRTYYDIFTKILSSIAEGENEVYIDMYEEEISIDEIFDTLTYNGFNVILINKEETLQGDYLLFLIKW